MDIDEDMKYKLGLSMVDGIGLVLARKLLDHCGSAEAVFKEKRQNLHKIHGIGSLITKAIRNRSTRLKIDKEIEFVAKNKIRVLFFTDDEFPYRLRHCPDSPVLLYCKGDSRLNSKHVISVVGTRKPSSYGIHFTEKLLDSLKEFDIAVISGMAYGIDGLAHSISLKNGQYTSGVLGHGLNIVYPFQHKKLFREVSEQGCLLTEFSSQDRFHRKNFAKRNRIVAGLCDAVIVIESGIKGGSLITANIANSYNREVFALPGRYTDKLSAGCNALIKNHKAAIIESADDFVKAMMWEFDTEKDKQKIEELMLILTEEESKIINYLNAHDNVLVEKMSNEISIPLGKLSAILLNLEIRGLVAAVPGSRYKLI